MRSLLFFLSIICPILLSAQNIRVGLFSDKSIKEIEGIVGKGTYFVFKDSIQLAKLGPADILKATYTGGVVRVVVNGVEKGRGKSIRLIQDKQEDYLQVRLISPVAKQRSYEGDFESRRIQTWQLDFIIKGYQKLNIDFYELSTGLLKYSNKGVFAGSQLYLGQLSPGTYVVSVRSEDGKVAHKLKVVKL